MPLPKVPASAGHFGQGIRYPLELTPAGRFAIDSGDVLVAQSLQSILETAPGSRVMQPDYGANVAAFEADVQRLSEWLTDQVRDHEPRCEIVGIEIDDDQANYLIEYKLVGEADSRTLTYPYFVGP